MYGVKHINIKKFIPIFGRISDGKCKDDGFFQNSWRSDLSKIEILNENQFIEYTKDGCMTIFTITIREPFKRWEFDMENDNIKGH